jgi:hypothetical protein
MSALTKLAEYLTGPLYAENSVGATSPQTTVKQRADLFFELRDAFGVVGAATPDEAERAILRTLVMGAGVQSTTALARQMFAKADADRLAPDHPIRRAAAEFDAAANAYLRDQPQVSVDEFTRAWQAARHVWRDYVAPTPPRANHH